MSWRRQCLNKMSLRSESSKKPSVDKDQFLRNQKFSVPYESEQRATVAKLAAEKYQRLTPLKHILYRPDSYIGSAFLSDEQPVYVYDAMRKQVRKKEARIVPGLLKIFDEILVNAADNKRRDPQMTTIAVNID
ncbi:unnamed protein product, partial [Litomosoides sigmodontis]